MTTWSEISVPTAPDEDEDDREVMLNREEFQSRLNEFRERVRLEPEDSSITEVMNWYTSINRGLLHHLNEQIKETDSSGVWRSVLAALSPRTVPLYSHSPSASLQLSGWLQEPAEEHRVPEHRHFLRHTLLWTWLADGRELCLLRALRVHGPRADQLHAELRPHAEGHVHQHHQQQEVPSRQAHVSRGGGRDKYLCSRLTLQEQPCAEEQAKCFGRAQRHRV